MKTCDVCGLDNGSGPTSLQDESRILTVKIGAEIQIARVGVEHECPVEIELCSRCIEKVNASINEHLSHAFNIRIRQ